jgi:hypothetical protein
MPDMDFTHLHVEFFMDAVENKAKSREAGRPVYDDREMVRIRIAGDKLSSVVAPAHDQSSVTNPHTQRRYTYAELHEGPYEAFKKGQEYRGSGTPLEELTFLTAAIRKTLHGFNIYTAEALAALDGTPLQKLGMGGREWKDQAQAYLDRASGTADLSRFAQENADLRAQLEALQEQMAAIGSQQTEAVPASGLASQAEVDVLSSNDSDDQWANATDDDLKAKIKELTGAAPRGTPRRETLIEILNDAQTQREQAEQVA